MYAVRILLLQGESFSCRENLSKPCIFYNDFNISLFALSTIEVSNEAKYMRVVFSESCPIASLIVAMDMFLLLAMLAHVWRAT